VLPAARDAAILLSFRKGCVMTLQRAVLSVSGAMAIVIGVAAARADFVESFDAPTWSQGQNVVGTDDWQTCYYYGSAMASAIISGDLASIGGRGLGTQAAESSGGPVRGAARAIGEVYTTGQVTLNAKVWGNGSAAGGAQIGLMLGSSDLVNNENNSIQSQITFNSGVNGGSNWYVARQGGVDGQVQQGPIFGGNVWYEFEIGIDLDAKTAYEGYYALNQSTLARTGGLNTVATFSGITLPSISHVGYMTQTHMVVLDEISVVHTPEPATIVLLCSGVFGLMAYAWRKRK
jgi:hypothetical protein